MSFFDKMRKEKLLSLTLLLFTLSVGVLIGTFVNTRVSAEKGQAAPDAKPLVIPDPVQLSNSFSQLAKKLEPSVVNITTDYTPKQAQGSPNQRRQQQAPDEEDPGFEFFHRFFGGQPFGDMQTPRAQGTGSGVIVDSNGYILTNQHVVDKADRIQVRLSGDTKEYTAKLIGTDQETDLAVIKIETPRKLDAAKIGNSDAVQVGDWALAIGSPFGLDATVTAGIISAKGRDISNAQFQHFLQTDAAINPGNSGGPLLNINGEVVGINTAIATQNGTYAGVGFALPINTAVRVYNDIIKTGRVTRGSIGIQLDKSAKPELLKVYGAAQGAFVKLVSPGTPADKAGLKEGDVVAALNGKPIKDNDSLVNAISDSPVGSTIRLSVVRDGQKTEIPVTVGDRAQVWKDDPRVAGNRPEGSERGEATGAKFGFSFKDLSAGVKDQLGYDGPDGVVVTRVDPGSFADDLGLLPNDVIVEINRQAVRSDNDLQRIQKLLKPGDAVAFKAMRVGSPLGRRGSRSPQWTSIYLADTLPGKQ